MNDTPNKSLFKGLPDEKITVEHFLQNFLDSKPVPIEKHTHDFCELVYVKNGICEHTYKDTKVTLMSDDVLLVLPNQPHEFLFSEHIDIFNCQFYLDELQGNFLDIVNNLNFPNLRNSVFDKKMDSLKALGPESAKDAFASADQLSYAPLNMQGIIHLSYSQASYVENLFERVLSEQANQLMRYQDVVKNCLEEVLIVLERIMADQFNQDEAITSKHQMIIERVLGYLDANFQNPLNFNDIAAAQDLSPNYFRKIFKAYTGTTPVDHLNRLRVLKALELLREHRNMTSGDVSEQVGIFDANYFARVFKKYIGYPPSHFYKKI